MYAEYLRLQTHTQNIFVILIASQNNSDGMNVPHCYVIHALPVLLYSPLALTFFILD